MDKKHIKTTGITLFDVRLLGLLANGADVLQIHPTAVAVGTTSYELIFDSKVATTTLINIHI